jgi:hypothetical protein
MVTANKKTYAVKEIENMVSVANISNRYTNEGMGKHYHGKFKGKLYPEMIGTTIDENKLKSILRDEIGSNNTTKLAMDYKNYLVIHFTFSLEGKVLETAFLTNNSTLITPAMFERIETRIKQEIHASFNETIRPGFTKPFYRDYDFIQHDVHYNYNKLVIN